MQLAQKNNDRPETSQNIIPIFEPNFPLDLVDSVYFTVETPSAQKLQNCVKVLA